MEASKAFRGSAISRSLVVAVAAVLFAFVLGGIGGYLVKTLSLPASALARQVVTVQPAAAAVGSAWNYSNRHSGTQSLEGPAPAASPTGASFREPTTGRSGPQS
jgi:hypothetical protein